MINCSIFQSSEENSSPSLLTSEFSESSSYGTAKIGNTYHTLYHFQFQVEERPPNPHDPSTLLTIYSGTKDVNASPFYSFVFDFIFRETDISSDTLLKYPEQLLENKGPHFYYTVYAFEDFDSFLEDSVWSYVTHDSYPELDLEINFLPDGVNMIFDGSLIKHILFPKSKDSVVTFDATYRLKYK